MSKIFCTLAFYHDGHANVLRPQLILSCNPTTNLVMKGSDWRGARIGNANAGAGSRDRFEYSFTGGKAVTRCSLVMNTSAILPPMVWLSKHPCGAPTKTGPRSKEAEQARRKAEWERIQRLEDGSPDGTPLIEDSERRRSRGPRDQYRRQELLEDRPHYPRIELLDDRAYKPPDQELYQPIPDRETRRLERRRRLESIAMGTSSPRQQYIEARRRDERSSSPKDEWVDVKRRDRDGRSSSPREGDRNDQYRPPVDHDARRRERRRRLDASSSGEGGKYRRSRRRRDGAGRDQYDDLDNDNGGAGADIGGGE